MKVKLKNLWGTTKTVLKGKYIAMSAFLKNSD
jgi:hypothetical protein